MTNPITKKLLRTDKNGTQYFYSNVCPRCGGTGTLTCYNHVEGGRCFKCEGTGYFEHRWKEYTPEYAKILTDRRLAKARASAPERNRKFMLSQGFSADGFAWIVPTDTFNQKETLKAQGATYNPTLGWHFSSERPDTIKVSFTDLTCEYADGTRNYDEAPSKITSLKEEYRLAHLTSSYIGTVGERTTFTLTYLFYASYTTHLTYRGETHYIYNFQDANGNKFIWNTTSYPDVTFEEGRSYLIKATIKEHSEYKGEKQTVLSRVKFEGGDQ